MEDLPELCPGVGPVVTEGWCWGMREWFVGSVYEVFREGCGRGPTWRVGSANGAPLNCKIVYFEIDSPGVPGSMVF